MLLVISPGQYLSGGLVSGISICFVVEHETIKKALEFDSNIKSVGIDTWGVDYGWLDKNGKLVQNPCSYREEIDKTIIDKVHSIIPLDELYQINGNAYFNFNTCK